MSLARRITVLVVVMSLASSALIFVFIVGLARQATREAAVASLERDADLLARVVQGSTGLRRTPGLGVAALQRALETSQVRTAVMSTAGAAPGEPWLPQDLAQLAAGEEVSQIRASGGRQWIVAGRPAGEYAVLLAQPLDVATSFVPTPRRRALIAASISAVFAAVGGALLARALSRPLVRLDAAARRLAAGERGITVAAGGAAEIADVGRALNTLSGALADSEDRQRRFLLTVSHELRTPLTAVTGYAEALADGVLAPADVPRAGQVIRSEAGRLQRRIEELLALARLEADDVTVDIGDVDVVALLRAAAAAWSASAATAGVSITVDVDVDVSGLWVRADAERLRQLVDALTDNALRALRARAGAAPGVVVLAAGAAANAVLVEVRDSGPGLAPEDLAVAFEPGLLTERYRGERPVGSGVGLALVSRLARLMGGDATAGTAAEGGLSVTVRLPGSGTAPAVHPPRS